MNTVTSYAFIVTCFGTVGNFSSALYCLLALSLAGRLWHIVSWKKFILTSLYADGLIVARTLQAVLNSHCF